MLWKVVWLLASTEALVQADTVAFAIDLASIADAVTFAAGCVVVTEAAVFIYGKLFSDLDTEEDSFDESEDYDLKEVENEDDEEVNN